MNIIMNIRYTLRVAVWACQFPVSLIFLMFVSLCCLNCFSLLLALWDSWLTHLSKQNIFWRFLILTYPEDIPRTWDIFEKQSCLFLSLFSIILDIMRFEWKKNDVAIGEVGRSPLDKGRKTYFRSILLSRVRWLWVYPNGQLENNITLETCYASIWSM